MLTIILTSILISLIFAPLGCLSLWKRYIYFSDGLAHASLLAGIISILSSTPLIYSGVVVALLFSILVFTFKDVSGGNSIISLISSFMLSTALIISYMSPSSININQLLFGDILSASNLDLITLSAILVTVIFCTFLFYNEILLIVLNRDIAQIRGIKVGTIELIFLILLAISVFSSIKIVGSLMVTSTLLISPMTARLLSSSPWQMIVISTIIALCSNAIALISSFYLDIPIAPLIITINAIIYFLTYFFNRPFA